MCGGHVKDLTKVDLHQELLRVDITILLNAAIFIVLQKPLTKRNLLELQPRRLYELMENLF